MVDMKFFQPRSMIAISIRPRPADSGAVDTRPPNNRSVELVFFARQLRSKSASLDPSRFKIIEEREKIEKMLLVIVRLLQRNHLVRIVRKDRTSAKRLDRLEMARLCQAS